MKSQYSRETKVFIMGGGIAGISAAWHLAKMRIPVLICDKPVFASYASTRNQGWGQCGALYTALGEIETAKDCRDGLNYLKRYASDNSISVFDEETPCFYMFKTLEERELFLESCKKIAIQASPITQRDIDGTIAENSILRWGVRTTDTPFDPNPLLSGMIKDIVNWGGDFFCVENFTELNIERSGDRWHFQQGEREVYSDTLLVACGAYIPKLLGRILPGIEDFFSINKVHVLTLHTNASSLSKAMIVTPNEQDGPNLVPIRSASVKGATSCLLRNDKLNASLDDISPDPAQRQTIVDKIRYYYPKFDKIGKIQHGIYCCQKLQLAPSKRWSQSMRSAIIVDHSEAIWGGISGLVTFYPGKFTCAFRSARHVSDIIVKDTNHPGYSPIREDYEPENDISIAVPVRFKQPFSSVNKS